MIVLFITALAAEATIEPFPETSPSIYQAPSRYEVEAFKPVDWTCNVRSIEGSAYIIGGKFDRAIFPETGWQIKRPLNLRYSELLQVSGTGNAAMNLPLASGGHWFEVRTLSVNYTVTMDYIVPGQQGYITILKTERGTSKGRIERQPLALGTCVTKGVDSQETQP